VVTDTGPISIEGVIETAEYQSTARAAITIRITDVSRVAALERRSARLSLATAAIICDRIVLDDVLPVTLIDLSETGCAVKRPATAASALTTDYGCTPASLKARSPPKSKSHAPHTHRRRHHRLRLPRPWPRRSRRQTSLDAPQRTLLETSEVASILVVDASATPSAGTVISGCLAC
jgi:hypothetical protein